MQGLVIEWGEHSFLNTIEEWRQVFHRCNWYTFHPFHLVIEYDRMCPGFEIECIVLGLGFRFRHNRSWEGTRVQQAIDDFLKRERE
jgi:hypothetical protein